MVLISILHQYASDVSPNIFSLMVTNCLDPSASRAHYRSPFYLCYSYDMDYLAIFWSILWSLRIKGLQLRTSKWNSQLRSKILCLYCFCFGFDDCLFSSSCGVNFILTLSQQLSKADYLILSHGVLSFFLLLANRLN